MTWLIAAITVFLLAAIAYQVAVAVELIQLGRLPGDEPPLVDVFSRVPPSLLLFGGLVLLPLAAFQAGALCRRWPMRSLGAVAGAFSLAHGAAFDPYNLPALIRFWDENAPPRLARRARVDRSRNDSRGH